MTEDLRVRPVDDPWTRRRDVLQILRNTDEEFHPPLSRRGASDGFQGEGGLEAYVDEALDHGLLVAEEDDDVVGVMIYRTRYDVEQLPEPSTYVKTVAVDPEHQDEGVGTDLYATLFDSLDPDVVSTKTWGTNDAHLSLLDDLGFQEVRRLPDHRPGDVDTVFLAKEM